ncbi:MAG: pilus assembly protein [Phycisphaerales bacterium]|jgi:hypothetical protein|nr:pilus assembly protein [Phycisphaerales bacterium]
MKRITERSNIARSVRRRGNVIIEFTMVIPFLAAIMGFTWFFGWAMTNQQHIKIADRYQTWRQVRAGSGVSAETLNKRIFQGYLDEDRYHQNGGTYSSETIKTLQGLVEAAGAQSPEAGTLAYPIVMDKAEHGKWITVHGNFPSDIGIFQQVENYQGDIRHTHMRDGREWRWRQLRCEDIIRDEFLEDLDSTLTGVPSPGNGLAAMARQLYLSRW